MGRCSKMRLGAGEGTTRRMLSPSGLNAQPRSAASLAASAAVVERADGLGRIGEGRVGGIDLDHGQQRRQRLVEGEAVPQLLLHQVADHPLGLGPQHVQRRVGHLLVGRLLQGQQTDLRAVAVRDDQLVALGDRRQAIAGHPNVLPLVLDRHRLTPAQQGISAQRHHDPHQTPPTPRSSQACDRH